MRRSHARPSELPSASPSPRGPSRPSRASSGTRSGSAAVGYGSAGGGGSHPRIGQLPPALQGLRRSLGLLRAPVQNPARDVLPQHRQASCRQSLRRQARTRASMVAHPCSGTTRGSRRQGLRAHGRGRWSLWTRYSGRLASGCPGAVPAYARLRSTSISHGIGWYRGRGGALASPPSRPAGRVSLVFSLATSRRRCRPEPRRRAWRTTAGEYTRPPGRFGRLGVSGEDGGPEGEAGRPYVRPEGDAQSAGARALTHSARPRALAGEGHFPDDREPEPERIREQRKSAEPPHD